MTEIRPSLIHGFGLFATTHIPQGTIIGRVEGTPSRAHGPYVLWLSQRKAIEVTNELKYINHASTPNACYYDDLTVVALADIQPGEEITHHYGKDYEPAADDRPHAAPVLQDMVA